ncbi:spore coat protein YsxE [Bacillus canaveralius]|uniref:Spore coat protein YsxE n=1 Tax=Bacillus canaveralius TaxID=1403243 RepID=A0A2N5GQ42_9BACI|nr:spore coat protein YsxE [Bacillus canaveralius]PLR84996.1 spore coat protein YsxE [Bacillus canaveralius]PLR93257.1 spore coat protein YsxE [Bacillus canaveralius]RSK52457.1 spore coat protein YsxE [Bacillus canaveralius]
MSDDDRLRSISPILNSYAVKPYFVEDFGSIQKIYSDKGTFALKKIALSNRTDFVRHIHFLYQKGYNRIVPIYPATDGRYAVLHKNMLYYLMPWLPNEERENQFQKHQQLFRELARLHTLSAKDIKITSDERNEHYETTVQQWEKDKGFLFEFIDQCEKKLYMSPFELMFCLYYHEISQALLFSQRKLEEWHEKTKDAEKARIVLVHGKVSIEHFLFDNRGYGYFINFEQSRPASPAHDLLPFLSRTLKTYPRQCNDCIDWVYSYFKYFPFKEDEMMLFLSYLAYPGQIIRTAVDYFQKTTRKQERKLVQQLQRHFWHLKNTEFLVMKIDEIERQKKQEKEGSQEKEGAQENNS